MNMKKGILGKVCLVGAALAVPVLAGAEGEGASGTEIIKSVIANGGGSSTGASFQLDGTVGQPVTGQSSGGSFVLQSGFWTGGAGEPQPEIIFKDGFES